VWHTSILFPPQFPFLPFPPPIDPLPEGLHYTFCPNVIIDVIIILGLGSTNWGVRTFDIWIFKLGLSRLMWWSPVPFSYRWCSFIYLYGWAKFLDRPNIFFIHSSVVGHLGKFHNFVIVKRAAINISM
jgi:hypothetical protein